MGKRLPLERPPIDRNIRKRKRAPAKTSGSVTEKCLRLSAATNGNGYEFHENDDEDSSSSGSAGGGEVEEDTSVLKTPQAQSLLLAGASFASDHNHSNSTESPRPVYTLRPSVVNGTILRDVLSKAWRLGRPIGKGNFGEIFLASEDTVCPVSSERAKFVVKIEPHSNGPLFVEIHCLINTSQTKKIADDHEDAANISARRHIISNGPPSGIPSYIASGTHYFGDARYRFLVLPRFDRDLHSLIKNSRVEQKCLLVLAIHIINVLEHLHDKGYCHNDIKAQNLMISKCKYLKQQAVPAGKVKGAKSDGYDEHYDEKQQTTDSGNSSEQETTDDVVKFSDGDDDYFMKNKKLALKQIVDAAQEDEEDEDFDDGATSNSNNSNSLDTYHTPVNKNKGSVRKTNIEFSGSNPQYAEQGTSEESDYSDHSEQAVRRRVGGGAYRKRTSKQTQTQQLKSNRGVSRSNKNIASAKFAGGAVSKSRSTPLSAVASNKRGCATRKENATVSSATDEVERKLKSRRSPEDRPKQRRTRRCLYKTESKIGEHDVENNSSLLEVQNLYSEYDDENKYIKGRNVNPSRHSRKL
ncbi:GL11027 [Drosophila persimilis]|uniref:non-specific serine/threonine protein kinase n=1 Tax=Drosophila persimilis TaxID=7234 RepID=B4GBU2_DROPE|nr:GL11027 [Drosophila persimilis]